MAALAASLDAANFIEYILALRDLTEDGVAPALHVLAGMIQEVVILHIDEELRCRGVRVLSSRHCDGAAFIFKAVIRFIIDRRLSGLLLHVGGEAAALNHEVINDAVENRTVIKATARVSKKVLDGFRRIVGV